MADNKALIEKLEALLAAYESLFLAARTTLEMAEDMGGDESVVHSEVLEELQAAYMAVYRQKQEKDWQ